MYKYDYEGPIIKGPSGFRNSLLDIIGKQNEVK